MQELGIQVDAYHTYEIFEPAIELSKKHFPFVVHHGDVVNADFSQFCGFDLVVAGTCCQSLSRVKQENDTYCSGLDGKSGIVMEYIRAVKDICPEYFLLENVVPKDKQDAAVISEMLGVEPRLINSNLFSAQDRPRLYWTNIQIKPLPERSPSVLADVMERNVPEKYFYKRGVKDVDMQKKVCGTLDVNTHDMLKRIYNPAFKCATLTCVNGGYQEKKVMDCGRARKLTPVEYERLQTLPDNFTAGYSDSTRYSLCGNGWNKETIKHILSGISDIKTNNFGSSTSELSNPMEQFFSLGRTNSQLE